MKTSLFSHFRVLFAVAGSILLYNYGMAQTVISSWAANTSSAGISNTGNSHNAIALTVNLDNVDETDSFSLLLTDENGKTVMNAGEYIMKKHENGFYYVEEKTSHDKITVFGNAIYFSTAIKENNAAKIKTACLKVRSKGKDRSAPGNEKTINTIVPKFKKG